MRWRLAEAQPEHDLARAAEVILSGLSYSHRAGTARLACEQVFDARTLPRHRLDRRQDRHADASPTTAARSTSSRACARRRRAARRRQRSQRVRTAASVQVVCRGVPDRSRRSALDEGDRRADRAQLARATPAASTAPATTARIPPRRSRMQIAARHAGHAPGDASEPRRARQRNGARRRGVAARAERVEAPLVWTFDGPFATCLADIEDTLRRAIVQVGDVSRDRRADRSVAAGAQAARRRGRSDAAGMGTVRRTPAQRYGLPAGPRVRHLQDGGPAGDAGRSPTGADDMALKGWVCAQGEPARSRARDLPPRATPLGQADAPRREQREPRAARARAGQRLACRAPQHLGAYAPLVGAIREELEQFVASHVRLHLAIAERDRYVLTSIEVECDGGDEARELLQRFMREFRPEQIKRYLAQRGDRPACRTRARSTSRSSPGSMPTPATATARADDERVRRAARGAARAPSRAPGAQPYEVSLIGRWSESTSRRAARRDTARAASTAPRTPLAGRRWKSRSRTRDGRRHVDAAVGRAGPPLRGRQRRGLRHRRQRQVREPPPLRDLARQGRLVGDRRGSTNGIRVESADERARPQRTQRAAAPARQTRDRSRARRAHRPVGARAAASRRDYPRLSLLQTAGDVGDARDADGAATCSAPTTPLTPIVAARARAERLRRSRSRMASGERTRRRSPPSALPFRIGRSRNQALVIDWAHEGVSGHHVDIVELDDERRARSSCTATTASPSTASTHAAGRAVPLAGRARRCVLGRATGERARMHADAVAATPTERHEPSMTPRDHAARAARRRERDGARARAHDGRRGGDAGDARGVRLDVAVASVARQRTIA